MRIALLSTLDSDPDRIGLRPAFASFAGTMVVERQLDLALRLGCEQIACLVDAVEREVVELQHRAESAGVKFRTFRQPGRLSGMVTADDDLFVIAPGILPDDDMVEEMLKGRGVLTFPADVAVPLGYERIDLDLAWAGIMRVRGDRVERLGDLPKDVDVPSSLMRLALQSGSKLVSLDREVLSKGTWHRNPTREVLDLREREWINAQRRDIPFSAPGLAVAERAGARLARDIVGQPAQAVPVGIAALSLGAGLAAGLLGHPSIGLGLAAIGTLVANMAGVVERVARLGRPRKKPGWLLKLVHRAVDPLFVVLLYIAAPMEWGILRAFVPLMLFGLLILGERHSTDPWKDTYGDRILLGFLLAPAAFFGFSTETAAIVALLALATRFLRQPRGK